MKKLYGFSALFAFVVGIVLTAGGLWGIIFTQDNITREKIITPPDASIPGELVNGPLTLKAQSDVIRMHTLKITNGKTYAEMPRQVVKLDESGNPVLDTDGQPIMVSNEARNIWVTATTLTTALHLGIMTYMLSGFVILIGLISIWNGALFFYLYRKNA